MKLIDNDIDKIKKCGFPRNISLSFGDFYIKGKNLQVEYPLLYGINEIISSYVLRKMGLLVPHIYLVKIDNYYYILSEDLDNYGTYLSAKSLGITTEIFPSLYEIWYLLEEKFGDVSDLIIDIVKMYLFDILFSNPDRHDENWGVVFRDNEMRVALIDHEFILSDELHAISSYNKEKAQDHYNNWVGMGLYDGDQAKKFVKNDLQNFFKDSSREFQELFTDFLEECSLDFFESIIEEIEMKEKVLTEKGEIPLKIYNKKVLIQAYEERYEFVNEIWKGLTDGRK